MGGGTEGISDNQEGVVILLIVGYFGLKHVINFNLTEVSVCFDQRYLKEVFKLLVGSAHD